MLHFLVKRDHAKFIELFRKRMAPEAAARIRIIPYEDLLRMDALPSGTYIFTSLGILPRAQRAVAAAAHEVLREAGCRILNHPEASLRRFDMLVELNRVGINSFRPYRVESDALDTARFPVFIRESRRHTGSLTALLDSKPAVDRSLKELLARGYHADDLIVVEYFDTSNADGIHNKYSAFRVGDAILPRYLDFSEHWMIKRNDPGNSALMLGPRGEGFVAEEARYAADNPHADWLVSAFDVAGFQYGRMDYGVKNGVPQVFEINTSPTFGAGTGHLHPLRGPIVVKRRPTAKIFYQRFFEALSELDDGNDGQRSIPFSIEPGLKRAMAAELRREAFVSGLSRVAKRGSDMLSSRAFDGLKSLAGPAVARATRVLR